MLANQKNGREVLTAFLMMMLMCLPVWAAAKTAPKYEFEHEVLMVGLPGDLTVVKLPGDDGKPVYENREAAAAIEWATRHGRVTVVTEGQYKVPNGVTIKTPGASLIVGPGAVLAGTGQVKFPVMIKVVRADEVKVFNFGTLDTGRPDPGPKGLGVQFEGQQRGKSGIQGGLIFATGELKDVNAGYWMVDTENMHIPLVWGAGFGNALVGMEGVHDATIGTIAALRTAGGNENEAIDMNMSCQRINIDHVIATAPDVGDEIVDINNSHYVTVNNITAFLGSGNKGGLLVGYDLYGHAGMRTKRPKLQRQKGHEIKNTRRFMKDVVRFEKQVSYPRFPESLPKLNVEARLTAHFADGSSMELVDHSHKFDLTKPSGEFVSESRVEKITDESDPFEFDILLIDNTDDPDHVDARIPGVPGNPGKMYEHYEAKTTIEWALRHADVVAITKGRYLLHDTIRIDEPGKSLIVGPGAELVGKGPEKMDLIKVVRADNVNVLGLGAFDGGKDGVAVRYHGVQDGESGINSGLLFSTAELKNVRAGYWAVDSANLNIPLIIGEGFVNGLLAMEGVHDATIGTVAALNMNAGDENEAIDLNVSNQRIRIGTVIGTAADEKDEIVDINSSRGVAIEKVIAFMGAGKSGSTIVRNRPASHSGLHSKRPKVTEDTEHKVGQIEKVTNKLRGFKKQVTAIDFPESLPQVNVQVQLIVEFEDDRTRKVLDQTYQFDLSPDAPNTVR